MDVAEIIFESVASAFGIDRGELTLETDLLNDLDAKSVNYFPIMLEIENEWDLDVQYQQFRSNCRTIGDIIDYVEANI